MIRLALLIGLFFVAAVSLVVAWWVRRQTRDRAGTVMIVILLVHALMATAVAGQILSSSLAFKTGWSLLWYALLHAVNPVWLLLAVYYTGREYWLTRATWGLLVASSMIPAALVLTSPVNSVLISGWRIEPAPFRRLAATTTGANEVLLIVTLVPIFLAFGLFFRQFLFSWRTARVQIGALLTGMASIFVPAILGANGFIPSPYGPTGVYGAGIPFGLYGSGVFGVIVAVGLFRTKLFGVAPLARDALFDSFDEGILVVDAELAIADYNDTAREYFPNIDENVGEALDRAYPAFVPRDETLVTDGGTAASEAAFETIEASAETGFAETVRSSNGDRTLRITVFEVASGGEPRGYGLIVRDVTELEAYAADLERKTEQLERFAGVLSHDLRNPVSIALGYVELEQEKRESENLRKAIGALDRIDETIADLLVLSREGEAIDDLETVSLRSVVEDAWTTSNTKTAALEADIGDETYVRADASRLQTLLENLFRNAVDHGGETVRLGSLEDGFFVEDDGPGIPEDERETVFEYGHSTREDGTGFGLAIVKSIVTAHDWSIAVTEGRDGGARFEVSGVEREAIPASETTVAGSVHTESARGSSQ
jgi:signal transduction histidine kinase